MTIYRVCARFKDETADAFLARLTDGSIAAQRPDGTEIVAAMERARVQPDGMVVWSEMCFCPTPLAHERETVFDAHFDHLTTKVISDRTIFNGRPFMDHLRHIAAGVPHS